MDLESGDVCKIKDSFYLTSSNTERNQKNSRIYMYLAIEYKDLFCLVPFETELFQGNTKGIYPIPSSKKKNAGLNFEKTIILQNQDLIEKIEIEDLRFPRSQKQKIIDDKIKIENQFNQYIEKYIKVCKKNRETREYAYRYTTLHEYKELLVRE